MQLVGLIADPSTVRAFVDVLFGLVCVVAGYAGERMSHRAFTCCTSP